MTDRFGFWQRWLFILSIIIVSFGIFMALFNQSPIFDLFNNQIDPLFWGDTSIPESHLKFQGWVYGVLGSTMAGWGLLLFFIVQNPFRQREKWAWNAIAVSLGFWYLLDTGISLYFGITFNAVFNTVLLILILPPILATKNLQK